jgi:hypothetical protein
MALRAPVHGFGRAALRRTAWKGRSKVHRQTLLTDLPSVARRCVARGVQHCAAMVDEELRGGSSQ